MPPETPEQDVNSDYKDNAEDFGQIGTSNNVIQTHKYDDIAQMQQGKLYRLTERMSSHPRYQTAGVGGRVYIPTGFTALMGAVALKHQQFGQSYRVYFCD